MYRSRRYGLVGNLVFVGKFYDLRVIFKILDSGKWGLICVGCFLIFIYLDKSFF